MRPIRLAVLAALLTDLAISANAAPLPPGAIIVTPLTSHVSVCLGDQVPLDLLVTDSVYGMPPGGATLTVTSSHGLPQVVFTPGGLTRLTYAPHTEGNDTIQILANSPSSAPGVAVVPATVRRCRWTWDLVYSGTYPHPEGFWKFSEKVTVAQGTLESVGSAGTAVEGLGTVAYSIDAHGEGDQVSCDFSEMSGSTTVKVSGVVGQPPGSMTLHFAFDPAPISGTTSFTCRIGPDEISLSLPVNETSAALGSLPLDPAVVPMEFGLISRPVSTAIFWLVSGSGRLTLVVTPVSDG